MDVYKEFVKSILPAGILDYFDLVSFDKQGESLHVYLEEQDLIPDQYKDSHYRSNGFLKSIKVKDFPIRDLSVTLQIKRRRWLLVETNKKVQRDWTLVAPGTRMSSSFANFLKELA